MAYRGRFRPTNPAKYKGDPTKIIYRSWWERSVFSWLDKHRDVIWWQSEEVIVPYRSPIDGRIHRYFPDVVVHKHNPADGTKKTIMIEIKPSSQCSPPDPKKKNATKTGRVSRRYLNEVKTWGINEAKWKAARSYCADRGWEFVIMTEKHIPGAK